MMDYLQHDAFTQHLNTTFQIHTGETETIDAELTEVSERVHSPRQERFSIVFRVANDSPLGQGMRRLEHDQMGTFDLFLVPIGQDDRGTYYEAVFNRIPGQTNV